MAAEGDIMRRWLAIAALAQLVGACAATDPDRLVFGVAGDRPAGTSGAEADTEMRRFLDWKLNQICTLGYDTVKVDTQPAEENLQIVDEDARCKGYDVNFLPDF
jgi:hypothetical protein